jgi:diguanylate cyclase (GGDEF)-like protein
MTTRVAFFAGSAARKLVRGHASFVQVEFVPRLTSHFDPATFDAALIDVTSPARRRMVGAVREVMGRKPVGVLLTKPNASALREVGVFGGDFVLEAWGPVPPGSLLAHIEASRGRRRQRTKAKGGGSRQVARRLSILMDIVKTANSILEPRKVIELVIEKVRLLVPSEAWSILLADEQRQELSFELALGVKGRDLSSARVKFGEGVAGWVAQTGKPAIVNDARNDPRFTDKFDAKTQFQTRSILCAPLVSRGRTIGVVEVINRVGGSFTRADLDLLLTLMEPCAIAIENAILFQRTEQLTITDDLTKLFNSRYLNLYLGREIKRCKRHGIPLSVIFLDLDGFKGINDNYGHLAGSGTLAEVGQILARVVRESDILARYGGDEFVVVLPETPASGALVIAERLRRAIEEHSFLRNQGLDARLSASFGISTYPDHALSPEGLIQKADQAMYRVKEREKNSIEVAV